MDLRLAIIFLTFLNSTMCECLVIFKPKQTFKNPSRAPYFRSLTMYFRDRISPYVIVMSTECLWYVLHWDRTSYRCVTDLSDWGVCQCGVERGKAPSTVNGPSCRLVQTFVSLRISGAVYAVVYCIYSVSKLRSFISKRRALCSFVKWLVFYL